MAPLLIDGCSNRHGSIHDVEVTDDCTIKDLPEVVPIARPVPHPPTPPIREIQHRGAEGGKLGPPVRHDVGTNVQRRDPRHVAPQQGRFGIVVCTQQKMGQGHAGRWG